MSTELVDVDRAKDRESQIRIALSAILSSAIFEASPGLSRLLTFLVEEGLSNRADNLKETYIGHVLFRRDATYDPKFDSIVRVSANRLRSRLLEYYAENPTIFPRITLRPGSYLPTYEFVADKTAPEETRYRQPIVNDDSAPPMEFHTQQHEALDVSSCSSEPNQGRTTRAKTWPIRQWAYFAAFALLVSTITVVTVLKRKVSRPAQWTGEPFSSLGGQEEFVAISPDGMRLAFSWTEHPAASPHIYLQALNEHTPRRFTSGNDGESRPAWSPDGRSIAFLHILSPDRTEVMVKSLSSGSEVKVADLHGSYPWLCSIPRLSWTSDGQKIYTSGSIGTTEACGVVAINVATGSLQPITQPPPGSIGDLETAISPDGTQVAFLRNTGTLGGDIYVTPVEGGAARRVTFDNRDIMGFCWLTDGSGFIVSSRRGDGVPKLWQISLDGKSAKPLTDGLTLAAFPAMSPQGDRIAFTAYRTTTSIWQVENGSEKLLISGQSSNSAPQLSPDGRSLVYRSDRTGSFELWISQLDGQNGIQLTDFRGPMVNNPRWSPDGTSIAFECRPQGHSDICLISPSHPAQVHVLNQWPSNEIFPGWSRDGKSIYFTSNHSGQWEIYRQPISSHDPIAITHDGWMRALPSLDGRWLYIFRGDESGELARIPTSDQPNHPAEAEKDVTILKRFGPDVLGKWDVDQDGLMYLKPSTSSDLSDADQERIIAINGDTMATHDVGVVAGSSPAGDLVFSTAANGKSFVYVKQGLKEGDIGFLVHQSAPQ